MWKGWKCGSGGIIEKYTDLYVSTTKPISIDLFTFKPSPNPTTGILTFQNNNIPDLIRIYNSNGVGVYKNVNPSSNIDLSELASGSYTMVIFKGHKHQAIKIIKD